MIKLFYILTISLTIISWFVFLTEQKKTKWNNTLLISGMITSVVSIITSLNINYIFPNWIMILVNILLIILPSLIFYNLIKVLDIKLNKTLIKTFLILINFSILINFLIYVTLLKDSLFTNINSFVAFIVYIMLGLGFVIELVIHYTDFKKDRDIFSPILATFVIITSSIFFLFHLYNNDVTDWTLMLDIIVNLIGFLLIIINLYILNKEYYNLKSRLINFGIICLQVVFSIFIFWLSVELHPTVFTIIIDRVYYIIIGLLVVYVNTIISRKAKQTIPTLNQRSKNKKMWADIYKINVESEDLKKSQKKLASLIKHFSNAKSVKICYKNKFDKEYHWLDDSGNFLDLTDSEYKIINKVFKKENNQIIVTEKIKHKYKKAYKILISYKFDVFIALAYDKNQNIEGYIALEDKNSFNYLDIEQIIKSCSAVLVTMQKATIHDQILNENSKLKHQIDNALKEVERSNNQLINVDDLKNDFIKISSHQLRTPLSTINGYLSLLLEDSKGLTKKQKNLLSEALFASNDINNSVNDFLAISQIKSGRYLLNSKITSIKEIINSQIKQAEKLAKTKNIKIINKTNKKDLETRFKIDKNKFSQAIENIINNAINYSNKKDSVTITTKISKGFWNLEIKDKGIGISKSDQNHIFDKFFRGKKAQKKVPNGNGTGLYLAKIIIEMHNGEIKLIKSDKNGSLINISLPINKNIN